MSTPFDREVAESKENYPARPVSLQKTRSCPIRKRVDQERGKKIWLESIEPPEKISHRLRCKGGSDVLIHPKVNGSDNATHRKAKGQGCFEPEKEERTLSLKGGGGGVTHLSRKGRRGHIS